MTVSDTHVGTWCCKSAAKAINPSSDVGDLLCIERGLRGMAAPGQSIPAPRGIPAYSDEYPTGRKS